MLARASVPAFEVNLPTRIPFLLYPNRSNGAVAVPEFLAHKFDNIGALYGVNLVSIHGLVIVNPTYWRKRPLVQEDVARLNLTMVLCK